MARATRKVTIADVEYVAYRLAKETMEWDEPIPDFGSGFRGKLESCINAPFQTFSRKNLYKGVEGKAAILFYLMIKNHPFQNGNKRIAITTLLYFLHTNNRWLRVDNQVLYEFAKKVAASDSKLKDSMIEVIEGFIETAVVKRS